MNIYDYWHVLCYPFEGQGCCHLKLMSLTDINNYAEELGNSLKGI